MSRSTKKVYGGGICGAKSEKKDKREWHKRLRRANRKASDDVKGGLEVSFALVNEVSNPWLMRKDGKEVYWTARELRNEINSTISTILNESHKYLYGLTGDVCEYFELPSKESIVGLTPEQIEEFVQHYLKMGKRK